MTTARRPINKSPNRLIIRSFSSKKPIRFDIVVEERIYSCWEDSDKEEYWINLFGAIPRTRLRRVLFLDSKNEEEIIDQVSKNFIYIMPFEIKPRGNTLVTPYSKTLYKSAAIKCTVIGGLCRRKGYNSEERDTIRTDSLELISISERKIYPILFNCNGILSLTKKESITIGNFILFKDKQIKIARIANKMKEIQEEKKLKRKQLRSL